MPQPVTGADLLRRVGLMPDGPGVLGRPIRASGAGVFVIELPAPLPRAPIDLAVVGKWIEQLDGLRLDQEPATSKALAARLAAFWIPSSVVLFVGSTDKSMAGRVGALERHVLGDRQPHPSSQWLKVLRVADLRVWWATCDAPEEYEDAVLSEFAATVPPDERAALFDQAVVLPFANLRTPSGDRKRTGITGAVVPEEKVAPPPRTTVVDLPPGDADGVPEPRNAGTTRRTNTVPPPAAGVRRPRAATPRGTSASLAPTRRPSASTRAPVQPVELTSDGHARLNAELDELTRVRRPEVIDRIKRARELGDLRENADYTAAREEQSFLEGRVQAIEAQLRHAVVVRPESLERVSLGSQVVVELDGEEHQFTIVAPAESDPQRDRISTASPVGKALVGRSVGDDAVVATPRGSVTYRIVSIGHDVPHG